MNEETEFWRDFKKAKQARRDASLQEFLSVDRSQWTRLSEHHFRRKVDEYEIDYWPNGKKAMVRGGIFARTRKGFKIFHPVNPLDVDRFCLNLTKIKQK